jgi:hypothetical protein
MADLYKPNRLISYVVASDTGLAPNITEDFCTLAVCKPVIRRVARIEEDWILGFSTPNHGRNRLIYAMQVEEKLPFEDYFNDPRFKYKKPDTDPRGDNFFKKVKGTYQMAFSNAAHFGKAGPISRDLKTPLSVIASNYWYFGENAPEVPKRFTENSTIALPDRSRRGHRVNEDKRLISSFIKWIEKYPTGTHGGPRDKNKIKEACTPS